MHAPATTSSTVPNTPDFGMWWCRRVLHRRCLQPWLMHMVDRRLHSRARVPLCTALPANNGDYAVHGSRMLIEVGRALFVSLNDCTSRTHSVNSQAAHAAAHCSQ